MARYEAKLHALYNIIMEYVLSYCHTMFQGAWSMHEYDLRLAAMDHAYLSCII